MRRTETGKPVVMCQLWEEIEVGWGERPDGFSLHVSLADRNAAVQEHWDALPAVCPAEYEAPIGEPFWAEVSWEVADRVAACSRASKRGVWFGPGASVPTRLV